MDTASEWVKRHNVAAPPWVVWADQDGELIETSLESASVEQVLTDIDDVLFALEEGDEEDPGDEAPMDDE